MVALDDIQTNQTRFIETIDKQSKLPLYADTQY